MPLCLLEVNKAKRELWHRVISLIRSLFFFLLRTAAKAIQIAEWRILNHFFTFQSTHRQNQKQFQADPQWPTLKLRLSPAATVLNENSKRQALLRKGKKAS